VIERVAVCIPTDNVVVGIVTLYEPFGPTRPVYRVDHTIIVTVDHDSLAHILPLNTRGAPLCICPDPSVLVTIAHEVTGKTGATVSITIYHVNVVTVPPKGYSSIVVTIV
jgi:hypothetical protein